MKKVTEEQFLTLTGIEMLGHPALHDNQEFYAGDRAWCILVRDRVDNDFGFVIFERTRVGVEPCEVATSIEDKDKARKLMLERADKQNKKYEDLN
jgi:hypothetical protein